MRPGPRTALRLTAAAAALAPSAAMAEGMPQLDFANPMTVAQVVWLGIIFALMYFLLSTWALPQVGQVLQARADRIGADLEQARLAKSEADAAEAQVNEATRAAQAAAQAQVSEAVAQAKARTAAQAAETASRLDAQLAQAEQRIAAARASALGAVRGVAMETASAVVARLTRSAANDADVARAVDAVLAARRAA